MKTFLVFLLFFPVGALAVAHKVVPDQIYKTPKHPKHLLDLYVPKNKKKFPTFVFVHGGGWRVGDKSWYSEVGETLADHGFGVALINYRLHPEVTFPDNARDVAEAYKWVLVNIEKHGGDKEKVFIGGHSAGAHLASLVACDKKYGLDGKVRGMVLVSGIYTINIFVDLGGFGPAFDKANRTEASPSCHVRKKLPEAMILYADDDIMTLEWQSMTFHDLLKLMNNKSSVASVPGSDHTTIIDEVFDKKGSQFKKLTEFLSK